MPRVLLVPGRHLAHTRAQHEDLERLADRFDLVVFAITSANQHRSRYSPIPFHVRAIGVDRFARSLGLRHRIAGIPHFAPTDRFARNLLTELREQTEGALGLEPRDTVVLSDTPELGAQFTRLGYEVWPRAPGGAAAPGPLHWIRRVAELGADWERDAALRDGLTETTRGLWRDFPEVPLRIARLYRDPLLDDAGSLTETRDYGVYVFLMSNPAILEQKYADVRPFLLEGKIVDEGCADGALLARMARDLPDSDLIGIEITGEFIAQCEERLRRGEFGGTHAYFHQRNLFHPIFADGSIDTTICNSTLHELWSYGEGEATVRRYLELKRAQLRIGGRIVVRDVCGPADKDELVRLWCRGDDGADDDTGPVEGLSTRARFRRFARDFFPVPFEYREVRRGGEHWFELRRRDAAEYMAKKDYVANWASEMHEVFTFWDLGEWRQAFEDAGLSVLEGTRAYTNPWISEHRWRGRLRLESCRGGVWGPDAEPVTNVVLAAERR